MTIGEKTKKLLAWIVICLAFAFIIAQIVAGYDKLFAFSWRFRPLLLLAAFAFQAMVFLITPWAWIFVLRGLNEKPSFSKAFKILYLSAVARWVPGKIWVTLGQFYIAERMGMRKASIAVCTAYQFFAGLLAVMLILGAALFFGQVVAIPLWLFGIGVPAFVLVLLLIPGTAEKALNWLLAMWGREPVAFRLSLKLMVGLLFIMILDWIVLCMGFVLFVAAITPVDPAAFLELGVTFISSYLIGFFAFFVPSGLGVREGALTALMPPLLGIAAPVAGAVAIVARLWWTLFEVGAFLIARVIRD